MVALELDQELGHSRARSAHQISQVFVSCGYRKTGSLLVFDAEILAYLEQRQRETLPQRATHEVRAAQLNQIPATKITNGHPLEVFRGYSQRDLYEGRQVNGSNLTIGNSLAAK